MYVLAGILVPVMTVPGAKYPVTAPPKVSVLPEMLAALLPVGLLMDQVPVLLVVWLRV